MTGNGTPVGDLSRKQAEPPGDGGRPRVAVVGDILLDRDVDGSVTRLAPDAPVPVVDVSEVRQSPGGAGLAALLCAQRADVVLVAPIADDADGQELRRQLSDVTVVPLRHDGPTRRKTRVRSSGQGLVRLDDGGPGTPLGVNQATAERVRDALTGCDAVLVADYGGGVTQEPLLREVLAESAARVPLVWDPHPRGGEPVPGAALVTPNAAEAERAARQLPLPPAEADTGVPGVADVLRRAWDVRAVSVTAGDRGAFVATRPADDDGSTDDAPGVIRHLPTEPAHGPDPCGAGDRFAATVTDRLARGDEATTAVREGVVAASAWVASGGADGFRRARTAARQPVEQSSPASLEELGARMRAAGGVLVATSGCFDLLHAGHVTMLDAARQLGEHLVVLVNSDRSVRHLKGPERPVVPLADRLRVLESLASVDAAVVMDDDEPSAAVSALRPDIWAKGGDYTWSDLPEASVVRSYGGRVVTLPYLPGRSTTGLFSQVRAAEPLSSSIPSTLRRSS
ncbi:PfkB family carbohydrate kinase [Promicromonospora iranensis]|uniref:RfaE bifunctional protein nucleotidyltransferase chain/domain/rfaE bifunctional protein kinase chain/domain n=1 Tax=Promicromonospora iranensis TaxID=1105144 RepID=A0ABU2CQJ1_9MICO|nr:PfkB family carbohydrate kinase [Promicromonospora iranensis]MDR7383536.1 rfaE bifunctional protein nucleotidyltransferase chain/domain/rfaE bifunctional protein kinase chain/domain [Promicromonospora iranensis]